MRLGAFAIRLALEDVAMSCAFSERRGFTVFGGKQDQRWLIMKNETTTIGLFQGIYVPSNVCQWK